MTQADPTRFVLIGASHPGNVGAAARALKVTGFSDLVLVAPRFDDVQRRDAAVAMASGATDVLGAARVVDTLEEALDGITYACATAMTPRDFGPPTQAPRTALPGLARTAHRVAFVFGSERFGLGNDDVYRCQLCLSIPTAPGYGSLNLAQALQLIAYEWREALGGHDVAPRTLDASLADATALQGLVDHWERVLVRLGYLDPQVPRKLMHRLRRLAQRAVLTQDESQILRGIARSIETATPAAPADAPTPSAHAAARPTRNPTRR